jgi:hypothetical protein
MMLQIVGVQRRVDVIFILDDVTFNTRTPGGLLPLDRHQYLHHLSVPLQPVDSRQGISHGGTLKGEPPLLC